MPLVNPNFLNYYNFFSLAEEKWVIIIPGQFEHSSYSSFYILQKQNVLLEASGSFETLGISHHCQNHIPLGFLLILLRWYLLCFMRKLFQICCQMSQSHLLVYRFSNFFYWESRIFQVFCNFFFFLRLLQKKKKSLFN